jgi:putative SOS response-associated peptidase YedK
MCGRYANSASTAELIDEFAVQDAFDDDLPPSWNIAPTDPVRIITYRQSHHADDAGPVRQLRTVRWGLVPSWSRDAKGAARMINARSETITDKPAFRAAAGRRRALIPALGYYEWQKTTGRASKVPYFLHGQGEHLLAFAGLYEIWRDPTLPDDHPNKWLWTSTIVTRPATDALGHIHDRCPVLVPPDLFQDWLDCTDGEPSTAQALLNAIPEPELVPRVVAADVGNVRNNGPQLIEPAGGPQPQP